MSDIPNLPDDPLDSKAPRLLSLARATLSEHFDAASIGRIVQASQDSVLSKDRIQTEHMAIGSRLVQIDEVIFSKFEAASDNRRTARRNATALLIEYSQRVLDISRSTMFLHMSIYRRFLHDHKAVTLFNVGELAALVTKKVSNSTLLMVIEEKEKNQKLTSKDIRELLRQARETDDQLLGTTAQLESTRDELSKSVSIQHDLEFEIKQLRAQANQSATERDSHRAALSDAQVNLARSNGAVSELQIAIDDLTLERDRLAEQLANTKARVETKEVTREVPPAGFATIEEAIAAAEAKLEHLNEEMARLTAAKSTIDSVNTANLNAETASLWADLTEHFETMVTKFSRAQLRILMQSNADEYRPKLQAMAAIVNRYHSELNAAINLNY